MCRGEQRRSTTVAAGGHRVLDELEDEPALADPGLPVDEDHRARALLRGVPGAARGARSRGRGRPAGSGRDSAGRRGGCGPRYRSRRATPSIGRVAPFSSGVPMRLQHEVTAHELGACSPRSPPRQAEPASGGGPRCWASPRSPARRRRTARRWGRPSRRRRPDRCAGPTRAARCLDAELVGERSHRPGYRQRRPARRRRRRPRGRPGSRSRRGRRRRDTAPRDPSYAVITSRQRAW